MEMYLTIMFVIQTRDFFFPPWDVKGDILQNVDLLFSIEQMQAPKRTKKTTS